MTTVRTSRVFDQVLVAAAISVASAPVFAQAPVRGTGSSTSAEVKDPIALVSSLNTEAIARMKAGDFAGACPKLEEAVRLAPEAATGARINLADCYAKTGRASLAYTQYAVVATLARRAGQAERVQIAEDGMTGLQGSVGVLSVDVPAALFSLSGLILTLDGVAMPELQWAKAIGLKPGTHTIDVSAPGHVTRKVQVQGPGPGKVGNASIPMLEPTKSGVSSTGSAMPTPIPPEERSKSVGPASPGREPWSKLPGFIGLGVGGAALVAGGVLVGLAASEQSAIVNDAPTEGGKPACGRTARLGEDAFCADLRSRAGSASGMGNTGIGVLVASGVIVAAAAVYLLLPAGKTPVSSRTSYVAPVVGQNGGGLFWTGSF